MNMQLNTEKDVEAYCGSRVVAGPFKGLYITPSQHWWGGDIEAKWLGSYEQPIHYTLELELNKEHDLFINIGCGDGYYGAGVGIRNPACHLELIDIAQHCEALVDKVCCDNNVTSFNFSTNSTSIRLQELLEKAKAPWMLVDIEGAEVDLLNLEQIPAMRNCVILVEMHDFNRPSATKIMTARFEASHDIVNIQDSLTRELPTGIHLEKDLQQRVVTERRPTKMNWLYMLPKKSLSL
jgi:hypothetical protein